MQLKKLLALLLSAALALSLLAGCGGESVARSLLNLLDGKYANVSVEMDPDLEADLRQALSETENDDEAAIRAALETLLGSKVTFRKLGDGQQGDTAFDLIFYAGADPDKAAQSAYSQWNGTFSNLPDDGLYTAALAQVETENGIWLLVQATVDKAGTVDKPEPASVTGISVTPPTKTQYNPGEPFDPTGMKITVTYSDGSTKTISSDYSSKGVTWSPANINDNPTTVTITYGGKTDTVAVKLITLDRIEVSGNYQKEYTVGDSFNPADMVVTATYSNGKQEIIDATRYTATINDTQADGYRFTTAQEYTVTVNFDGQTATVTITVHDNANGYYEDDGTYFVTGSNGLQTLFKDLGNDALSATITLTTDQTVTVTFGDFTKPFTGTLDGNGNTVILEDTREGTRTLGLFDQVGNGIKGGGTVKNLKIQLAADISFEGDTQASSGAVAGTNYGTIQNCDVDLNGYSITDTYGDGTGTGTRCAVGGIAGENQGRISGCSVKMDTGSRIFAKYDCERGGTAAAGGIAGSNTRGFLINGTVTDCTVTGSGTITATLTARSPGESATKIAAAGGLVGYNDSKGAVSGTYSGTITAQYNDGEPVFATDNQIGNDNTSAGNNCAYAGTGIGYDKDAGYPVGL